MTIRKQSLGFKRITGNYEQDRGNKLTLGSYTTYAPATPTTSYVRWTGPASGSVVIESGYTIPVAQTGISGYQNPTRVASTNYIGNILKSPTDANTTTTVKLLLVGGGGGGGYPRGNGSGGNGGGGGYAYTASLTLPSGTYPIGAGAGGGYGGCSNLSGAGGTPSTAFGYTAGSGGGGTSEHNGNCNGCWPGGPGSSSLSSHANGYGGGCNFGAGSADNAITVDITGSPFTYGPLSSGVGGGSPQGAYSPGNPGTVIIQFTNSSFIEVVR